MIILSTGRARVNSSTRISTDGSLVVHHAVGAVGGNDELRCLAVFHPFHQWRQLVPGIRSRTIATMFHPGCHEELYFLFGRIDVAVECGRHDVFVVIQGGFRTGCGVRPAVVKDQFAVVLEQKAVQIGIGGIGDRHHQVK